MESCKKLAWKCCTTTETFGQGEKFADADLMGIPYRLVVSEKTLEHAKYELKNRTSDDAKLVSLTELTKLLAT